MGAIRGSPSGRGIDGKRAVGARPLGLLGGVDREAGRASRAAEDLWSRDPPEIDTIAELMPRTPPRPGLAHRRRRLWTAGDDSGRSDE